MNLFYLPNIHPGDASVVFSEEESIHCARVLRLKEGDNVLITNGKGWLFEAVISVSHPKHSEAFITLKKNMPRDSNFHLHLAVAPTKNIARFEWFLEKACEIGVDEITPLICTHSERQKLNLDRLERVLIAAMKQSQTATMPVLHKPCELQIFSGQCHSSQKFVAWCGSYTEGGLFDLIQKGGDVVILIGPEGDFSEEEIILLKNNKFKAVSMGTQRLRTETAAIVACCTVNLKNRT